MTKMPFAEDNEMIKTVPPLRSRSKIRFDVCCCEAANIQIRRAFNRLIPCDARGAWRSLTGRHGSRSATGRAPLNRRIDLQEHFFEGIAISRKKFPILWVLLILQVIKGCPSPSKLTKDISQSENREQRHNRNDGI